MRHNLLLRDRSALLARALWIGVVVVALVVVAYSTALQRHAAALRGTVSAAQIRVAALRVQLAQADAHAAPFRQAAEVAAELGRQAADPGLLRRFESGVPADVWFTGVTLSRNTMGIDGRGLTLGDIARTVEVVRKTPGIVSAEATVVTRSAEGWYAFHLVAEPQGGPQSPMGATP